MLRPGCPDAIRTPWRTGRYLRRSMDDVIRIMAKGPANFRLCKGIYIESETIAYKDREQIRENYIALLERMFAGRAYVGIATHDEAMIKAAEELIKKYA